MEKAYDTLARTLLEAHPADWLALLGLGGGAPVRVVNSDVSTVTAEADKVLLVEADEPWLVHIELQTSYKTDLPRRLLRYNALLNVRHNLPVHSSAILMFPEADGPAMDGLLRLGSPDGRCRVEFHYQVARIWEMAPEAVIAGVGTVALAPLVLPNREDLPPLVENLKAEFARHPTSDEGEIWTALYILIGRRFQDIELANRLLRGIQAMEDSATYQLILSRGLDKGIVQGRAQEARSIIMRAASRRFGPPEAATRRRLEAIDDRDRLEAMVDLLLEGKAQAWDDLFRDEAQAD